MKFATIKIAAVLLFGVVTWSTMSTSAEACRRCRGWGNTAYRPLYSANYFPSSFGYSSYYRGFGGGFGGGFGSGYGAYYGANNCQPPCDPCGVSACSPCGTGDCPGGDCTVMSSPQQQQDGWTPTEADQPKTFDDDSQPDLQYDEPAKSDIPDPFGGRESAPDTSIPPDTSLPEGDTPADNNRSFRPPSEPAPAEELIPKKPPVPPKESKEPAPDTTNPDVPEVNIDAQPTIPVLPDLGRGVAGPKQAFQPGTLGWDSRLTWRSEPEHRRLYIRSLLRKPVVQRKVVDPNSEWKSVGDRRIATK